MKKLLAILLAIVMMLAVVACDDKGDKNNNDDDQYKDKTVIKDSETSADGVDTFYYENVDSETVIIVGFSTTNDKKHPVTIPAYFVNNGGEEPLRVVGIGKEAFNCSSSVQTLIFPTEEDYRKVDANFDMSKHSFTIADYALRECVALESLTIPAYVTEIGPRAFYGCVVLKTLTFAADSGLKTLADGAFMMCSALEGIEIPASVREIGANAFYGCDALESVVINEGTVAIGAQAFEDCVALAEVKLPTTLENIGTYAFQCNPELGDRALYKDGLTYEGTSEAVKAYISSLALEDRPAE